MQGNRKDNAAPSRANNPCSLEDSTRLLLVMLNKALQWSDETFQRRYPELVAQIESDCRQQEEWLELLPPAFSRQHMEEHARMLSVMHHTALCVMQGNIDIGRSAVFLLADWVRVHAETMDKPMAAAILNKRLHVHYFGRLKNDLINIG